MPDGEAATWEFVKLTIGALLTEKTENAASGEKRLSRHDLLTIVLTHACTLHRIGGSAVIAAIAEAIRGYDERLFRAISMIASSHTI